jgi:hypothetical protein
VIDRRQSRSKNDEFPSPQWQSHDHARIATSTQDIFLNHEKSLSSIKEIAHRSKGTHFNWIPFENVLLEFDLLGNLEHIVAAD